MKNVILHFKIKTQVYHTEKKCYVDRNVQTNNIFLMNLIKADKQIKALAEINFNILNTLVKRIDLLLEIKKH